MRSNTYDSITTTLAGLSEAEKKQSDLIQKSEEGQPLDEAELIFKEMDQPVINAISTILQKQFDQLKADFQAGRIPQTVYSAYLKKLKSFLTERKEKFVNPNLDTITIIGQIKKFCLP